MFEYKIRHAFKTNNLLIEFTGDTSDSSFLKELKSFFEKIGATRTDKKESFDDFLYKMVGDFGEFEVFSDSWGNVSISSEQNQFVIQFLDQKLSENQNFVRIE